MAETTWTQSAGMVSDEDTDNLESYSEQAEASKDAAAVSAAAAEAAKVAAAASEAAALASKNSAATSATTATTGAATATTKASEAAASATSASTSATAAQTAQAAAEAAETAAAASEAGVDADRVAAEAAATAAAASETAAATSEANSATSETNAASSATASASSATASAASATAASASETAATASETAAAASEAAAATSETNAATSASNAATSESNAASSASAASTSETNAAASETATATSETNAATSETNAATSETNAASSASAASTSETNAAASEAAATASETAAATSETNAATSETNAAASAATATTKASEASASATAAASSASASATSATDSEAARDQSQDARDTAEDHKLAAEAAATSATSTAAALTGFDLEAIAESKAVTAVDVFVYDTSKDSDGGAWRKRTQGTSWYNETLNTATRGSRREFPAVAVIVAESDTVTIYDGDDPALPMWMVFNQATGNPLYSEVTSVSALNGHIVVGQKTSNGGVTEIRFINDRAYLRITDTNEYNGEIIADRNDGGGVTISGTVPSAIVNRIVNDVAMTVLPNAPIDAATGLPVPTIAVATAGGVSVITDAGAVYDITWANHGACGIIAFNGINQIVVSHDAVATRNRFVHVFDLPSTDISEGNGYSKGSAVLYLNSTTNASDLKLLSDYGKGLDGGTHGGINGLAFFDTEKVAYTTSTYNTGWMNGNIKGAFLSDTDDTDLVGGEIIDLTPDTIAAGWTNNGDGSYDQSGTTGYLIWTGLTIGESYTISFDVTARSGGSLLGFIDTAWDWNVSSVSNFTGTFIAKTTSVSFWSNYFVGTLDNISVKLADADRSVNANGLIVKGTVTRSPVATGADLVAYSGFSSSNYLEQPYNSDLDFGTGDFCIMGWFKHTTSTSTQYFAARSDGSSGVWQVGMTSVNDLLFVIGGGAPARTAASAYADNIWNQVVFVREAGVAKIYLNGSLTDNVNAGTSTASVDLAASSLYIGDSPLTAPFVGSLALLRISATTPSAEQIAKIYNDEKVLFQEDAQATLYGTSDAVTALAHDDTTDLLHVGSSAGRSVFQGLRRVSNTTNAVGAAISASNGLVVEE